MSSYTITIAPDDHTRATTTLRVEVTDTAARITELLVRAGDGDGLTAGQLPAVDLDQLLRAVTPVTSVPVAITAAAPKAPETPTELAGTEESAAAAAAAAAVPAAEPQPAPAEPDPTPEKGEKTTTSARPRRSATAARKSAASDTKPSARINSSTKAAKATRKSQAAKAAPSARKTATKRTTAAASANGERVYRRSPQDLAEVYQQAGTVAAIADHYGVPRHTAQSWVRTLLRRNDTGAVTK